MRPARGLLLVRPVEAEESYAGGCIIVPESARQRLTAWQAELVATGEPELCKDEDCERRHFFDSRTHKGVRQRATRRAHDYGPFVPGAWLLVRPRNYIAADERAKLWLIRQCDVLAVFCPSL